MYQAPRGTSDILPEEQAYWRYIEQKVANICQLYGYERIDAPTFEDSQLFSRSVGEGTDIVEKEMYTFQDKGGEQNNPETRGHGAGVSSLSGTRDAQFATTGKAILHGFYF